MACKTVFYHSQRGFVTEVKSDRLFAVFHESTAQHLSQPPSEDDPGAPQTGGNA